MKFIPLAMSVAVLHVPADHQVSGSHVATWAAEYLPVTSLGYYVIGMIIALIGAITIRILSRDDLLQWPTEHMRNTTLLCYSLSKIHSAWLAWL
jgi:hypothetical protein